MLCCTIGLASRLLAAPFFPLRQRRNHVVSACFRLFPRLPRLFSTQSSRHLSSLDIVGRSSRVDRNHGGFAGAFYPVEACDLTY